MKNVLSIAGSDSSGGAGIQADLKTMCALGVYGMTAITAITAQNTQGVYGVEEMQPSMVAAQIEAVFTDIRVDAVKIGMVFQAEIIHTVAESLKKFNAKNIVVDPVMMSKSGCRLMQEQALAAMGELIVIADILTPNIPEAEFLCGFSIKTENDMRNACEKLFSMGAKHILLKGGHRFGEDASDMFFSGGEFIKLYAERINTKHTHGTGCTLSSAVASRLALGDSPEAAVRAAKDYITRAINDAYPVGKGVGPVGHLCELYRKAGINFI
jgi:hydroxymethylpyrimidine/phosphomethylpyrimidine kinase